MEDKNLNEVEIVEEKQSEAAPETEKKCWLVRAWQTVVRWTKRMFFGGANAWFTETKKKEKAEKAKGKKEDVFAVEKIISPGKQRVKNFLSKKLAVGATCVLARPAFWR